MKLSELFEDHTRWVIGALGSNGLLMKSQGVSIKLDHQDTDALVAALKAGDEVVVKTTDIKAFRFVPEGDSFYVQIDDDQTYNKMPLSQDEVQQIIQLFSAENGNNSEV